MEIQLRDAEVEPSAEAIANALGDSHVAYEALMAAITGEEFGFVPEWRYYNDGKAWLCKVTHRKKTVFWLSVWDGAFKAVFYFTDKNRDGISGLDISENIKTEFLTAKPVGKLLPLGFTVAGVGQLRDLLAVARYKSSLK